MCKKSSDLAHSLCAAAMAATLVLTACSGSSSGKPKPTPTVTTATVASTGVAGPGTVVSSTAPPSEAAPGTAVTVRPHAAAAPVTAQAPYLLVCSQFLSPVAALLGVVREVTLGTTGALSSCAYVGTSGKATLSVAELGDTASAHTEYLQAAVAAGTRARAVVGIGDEAFMYAGGIQARVGHLVLTITCSPAPKAAALQTAARTVVSQL